MRGQLRVNVTSLLLYMKNDILRHQYLQVTQGLTVSSNPLIKPIANGPSDRLKMDTEIDSVVDGLH